MSDRRWNSRWNDWNLGHIAEHGVSPDEVEEVVEQAKPPFPEHRGDGKWGVWGKTANGRHIQVMFVHDDPGPDDAYVIHARPLTEKEKRIFRRQTS